MTFETFVNAELMKYGIVFFAGIALVTFIVQGIKLKRKYYSWLYWAKAFIMAYWVVYYLQNLAKLGWFTGHEIFVRAGIMLTCALLAACGITSLRRTRL